MVPRGFGTGGAVMDSEIVQDKTGRVLRSGVFANQPRYHPTRLRVPPGFRDPTYGFRPARNLQLSPFTTYPPSAGCSKDERLPSWHSAHQRWNNSLSWSVKQDEELTVITKTCDLILWSCNHTGRFPRVESSRVGIAHQWNAYSFVEHPRREVVGDAHPTPRRDEDHRCRARTAPPVCGTLRVARRKDQGYPRRACTAQGRPAHV